MYKSLKNLKIEEMLFMDIETVSRNKELEIDSREYLNFQWKNRQKDNNDEFLTDDELSALYKKTAALHPAYNKIVCISVAYIKDSVLYYKSLTGSQEDIIRQYFTMLNSGKFIPVGFNIVGFDVPTIRMKGSEEGLMEELNEKYSDVSKKPWDLESTYVDLMKVFKGTYFYNLSFDEVCMIHSVESPKSDINGSQVTEVYYDEGVERIAEYCNRDVIACAELFCVLIGERGYITDKVDKSLVNKEVGVDETSPFIEESSLKDVLLTIYKDSEFSNQEMKKVKDLIKSKRLTKKDKEDLSLILYNLYVNTKMFKSDKDEIKRAKRQQVKDFIESL